VHGNCFPRPPAELIQRTGERPQAIIVVLVRLVRSTVEFIHAVVTVLARQPDLNYERRFVLVMRTMGRAPLLPRPIPWRRLLPSTPPLALGAEKTITFASASLGLFSSLAPAFAVNLTGTKPMVMIKTL
jgi:hypothetical protein